MFVSLKLWCSQDEPAVFSPARTAQARAPVRSKAQPPQPQQLQQQQLPRQRQEAGAGAAAAARDRAGRRDGAAGGAGRQPAVPAAASSGAGGLPLLHQRPSAHSHLRESRGKQSLHQEAHRLIQIGAAIACSWKLVFACDAIVFDIFSTRRMLRLLVSVLSLDGRELSSADAADDLITLSMLLASLRGLGRGAGDTSFAAPQPGDYAFGGAPQPVAHRTLPGRTHVPKRARSAGAGPATPPITTSLLDCAGASRHTLQSWPCCCRAACSNCTFGSISTV